MSGENNWTLLRFIQENNISTEFKKVLESVTASNKYADMKSFADTCKSWLVVFIRMGPDCSKTLLDHDLLRNVDGSSSDTEPLSPSSAQLRHKAPKLTNVFLKLLCTTYCHGNS